MLRTSVLASSRLRLRPVPAPILTAALFRTTQVRYTASSVSSQPASKDMPSAVKNAKEEASHVAGDLAKTISGGQTGEHHESVSEITREKLGSSRGHSQGMAEDFVSVTSAIASHVPKHIFVFGLAGALPYLGSSLSTLYFARQAGQASTGLISSISPEAAVALLESSATIQVTYGAVMLSFLGALHWGMEFAGYGGYKGYPRLMLGVAPLLVAWPTLAMEPHLALVAQWFAFTSLWYADMKVTNAGWTPKWFSQYRFYLSILVGTCILSTLFGINYLGPTTDVALAKHLKDTGGLGSSGTLMDRNIRDKEAAFTAAGSRKGAFVPADAEVKAEKPDALEDGYVKLVKRKEEEAEESSDDEGSEKKTDVGTPGDNAGGPGENATKAQEIQGDAKSKQLSKGPNKDLQGGGDKEEGKKDEDKKE